jgi:hypothetical protein
MTYDAALSTINDRLIAGARAYAAADKSDPFTLSRCVAHIRAGICTDGVAYEARATQEMRELDKGSFFSDGSTSYAVTVYREVRRP